MFFAKQKDAGLWFVGRQVSPRNSPKFWASTKDAKPPCAPRFAEVRWSRCQDFCSKKKQGKRSLGVFCLVSFWLVGFLLPKSSEKDNSNGLSFPSADKNPKSHPF